MVTQHDDDTSTSGPTDGLPLNEARIAALLQKIGPRPQPPAAIAASIKANLRTVWREEVLQQQARRQGRRKAVGFALAASVLVSMGASWLLSTPSKTAAFGHIAQVVNRVEYVDVDGEWRDLGQRLLRHNIELRTGSAGALRLHLNEGMDIRVGANTRLALRDAEALTLHAGLIYVDSNDQLGGYNSLRITTPFGEAEDIGTQFSVEVAPNRWQVQVREGLVQMSGEG
jgi:ferric-dicitrate binding protein FerR (iron transport regulator)